MLSDLGFRKVLWSAVVLLAAFGHGVWHILVNDCACGCRDRRIERAANNIEHDVAIAGLSLYL